MQPGLNLLDGLKVKRENERGHFGLIRKPQRFVHHVHVAHLESKEGHPSNPSLREQEVNASLHLSGRTVDDFSHLLEGWRQPRDLLYRAFVPLKVPFAERRDGVVCPALGELEEVNERVEAAEEVANSGVLHARLLDSTQQPLQPMDVNRLEIQPKLIKERSEVSHGVDVRVNRSV